MVHRYLSTASGTCRCGAAKGISRPGCVREPRPPKRSGRPKIGGPRRFRLAFPGGVSVAAGDVTGDGVADFIMRERAGGGPHLRAFSVVGDVLTELRASWRYGLSFGRVLSVAAGDVTGDGVSENYHGSGTWRRPHVRVLDVSSVKVRRCTTR